MNFSEVIKMNNALEPLKIDAKPSLALHYDYTDWNTIISNERIEFYGINPY